MSIRLRSLISLGISTLVIGLVTVGCKEQPKVAVNDTRNSNLEDSKTRDGDLDTDDNDDSDDEFIVSAICNLKPINDSKAKGVVSFNAFDDGVEIVADFEGLTPGKHGFHIHEKGDCSDNGKAAGGHFNPTKSKHGGPDSAERHVGDLGNVVADEKGNAHYERFDRVISLSGKNSIMGRSVVLHSKEDDLKTDPAGDSGDRVACGVIISDEE